MFCAFQLNGICDKFFVRFELFRSQIAKSIDIQLRFKSSESVRTLLTSVIVCRIYEAVFYFTVGDHDLCIFQLDRGILVFHCICVEKDSIVFFAHGDSELIHDTAVASVEIIFRVLSDQGQVGHGQFCNAVKVSQDNACENLQGCGRGKTGSVRDISPDDHIKAAVQKVSFFGECPYDSKRIVRPVIFFFICQVVKESLHNSEFVKVHGIEVHLAVVALSGSSICTHSKSAGENVASVVICVLTDQVDTARGKIEMCPVSIPEKLCKLVK